MFVALFSNLSIDSLDMIEMARGNLESHCKYCCNSSQQIACASLLISQCNWAGDCALAAEIPTNP
jgi:hypothetical protein